MLIVCPHCATSYDLSAAVLGENGRTVRCVRCKQTWFEAPATIAAEAVTLVPAAAAAFAEPAVAEPALARAQDSAREVFEETGDLPPGEPAETGANDTMLPVEGKAADFITPNVSTEDISPDIVPHAPSIVPPEPNGLLPVEQDGSVASATPVIEAATEPDLEQFVTRRAKRQAIRRKQARPGTSAAILILGTIAVALLMLRSDVVRFAPQMASLYARIGLPVNLRGLVFEDIKSVRETKDGVTVLVVEGTIASVARRPVEVPRIRFGLRNITGNEIYSWTVLPSRSVLEPGEKLTFRSRLASPPAEGNDVSVRFFAKRDAFSGTL
jgi:predicted Zn finger-like uncharacterized protein